MLSDEVINKVIERITTRIEETNTNIIKNLAESVAKFRTLTPSQAQKLAQIMRYGGDYEKIAQALAKMSKLNVEEIYKIFEEVAKQDYLFAGRFYKYRYRKYIPYEKNQFLQEQVKTLATITAKEYNRITGTLGFSTKVNGEVLYNDLLTTYHNLIDSAVLSVGEGKSTFNEEMSRIIKEIASSGVKSIDYANGRSYRLDSITRMVLKSGITHMHMELQEEFGKQFDADGVEISVHNNPAPDHELVQGKQFSINQYDKNGKLIKKGEFEKFQEDEDAVSYDGVEFPAISEETKHDRRAIGQYNCYHYTFSIILGVSEPAYTNEELQQIIDKNNKSFIYNNKKYNMYEGEQLQRKIELQLRKLKDEQIGLRAGGFREDAEISQMKINKLTDEYNKLLKVSGLPSKLERAKVSGYRKIKVVDKKKKLYN